MEKVLKSYLKKLTNISSSNRSLCLLRLSSEQDLDIHALDFLYKLPSFNIIEQLISGKNKIPLCDELDSRDFKINNISKNLKKIYRKDHFLFEEIGSKDLYVGWPFVKGKFSDGSSVRCPLLYFPISLQAENGKWFISSREEVEVSFNKTFLLAYSFYNKVKLSDEILETSLEEFDTDKTIFRTQLYEFLKNNNIEINFNQELFIDKLQSFHSYTKSEFEEIHQNGELKLYPEAVLGIFPQSGSQLVPDYEELLEKKTFHTLEDFFYSKSTLNHPESYSDHSLKEEHTFTPFPVDASQEMAIRSIKLGNSPVVQGPPGTGKSQLICNLISDFIARGKKVLLVCQKRAALDVVYERLKTKNIHPFIGLIHDFKNDRKAIYNQIRAQIEAVEAYEIDNNGLDTVYLERSFLQTARQIDKLSSELEEFKKALFDISDYGISVKELYLTSDKTLTFVSIQDEYKYFNYDSLRGFELKIKSYIPYAITFYKEDYLWKDRVSFADLYFRDQNNISETVYKILVYAEQTSKAAQSRLGMIDTNNVIGFFENLSDPSQKILTLMDNEDSYYSLQSFISKKTEKSWLIDKYEKIKKCFDGVGIEKALAKDQLDGFLYILKEYESRQKTIIGKIQNLFSNDKDFIKTTFKKNNLSLNEEGIKTFKHKHKKRKELEHLLSSLKKCKWLDNNPTGISLERISNWMNIQLKGLETKDVIEAFPELEKTLQIEKTDYITFKEKIIFNYSIAEDIRLNIHRWKVYLTESQIKRIIEDKNAAESFVKILHRDFESLVEFDKIKKNLLQYELLLLEKIIAAGGDKSTENAVSIFNNSIRLEWISRIEEKYPILRSVSTLKMSSMEEELQNAIAEKIKLSHDILQLKVREKTYRNAEYNRLNNMVTFRELYHQVTKKKKIWPVRKLVAEHFDEIAQIIPCWLASPESVSAIFPMKQLFDLIIFDEASQCFAEEGIPAMYRGKQIMITGDSKQLPPNDLYQSRWEDESDEIPDLEIDSLLSLSEKYLTNIRLNGHYRSKNLDLIDFSNQHFYNNSLRLLPQFEDVNKNEPSIVYQKTDGVWEENTNKAEAEEVAKLVKNILSSDQKKSIGIVTFNFKQAQHIQEVLEEYSLKNNFIIPEDLFIKNIENVQGDERDIIIFSIGYAPDKNNRFAMQFGSLNTDGGENRLNVAVTRAREKIYIISSILPQQLNVEGTKHEGPKLLKKYLEYAWNVSQGNYKPRIYALSLQREGWYLKDRIIRENQSYIKELPFADITIKKQNKYAGLMITDDDLYYSSLSAKDYHAYTPMLLKQKGWPFTKKYSRVYWEKEV